MKRRLGTVMAALLTGLLVGLAKASLLLGLQASTVWIKRASGVILI